MAPIPRDPIVSPAAWRGDQIGGKSGLARPLEESELVALDEFLLATKAKPTLEIRDEDFSDSRINELARVCRHELVRGRAALILTGLDPSRYASDGYRRIYWYLGQLIGRPAPQSERGDLLGYVRQEKDNPFGRGYISNVELNFHNDFHEVLSLACIQSASQGGESGLASCLTVHNLLLEERPDLLELLYEGWYDGLHAFYRIYKPPAELAMRFVPYFGSSNGVLSLHGVASMFNDQAAAERGVASPALIKEGVAAIQEIARRPGVAARFMLKPGEMVFWHNWTLLHARTAFENAPEHERVLMRLWLHPFERRAAPRSIRERADMVDQIHNQLRAQAVTAKGSG
jgi:hypothetical protein